MDVSIGIAEWDGKSTAAELFEVADAARCGRPSRPAGAEVVGGGTDERGDRLVELTKSFVRPWRDRRRYVGRPRAPIGGVRPPGEEYARLDVGADGVPAALKTRTDHAEAVQATESNVIGL